MSHTATKWAFDQPEIHKDMKPAEWAVLIVLADCHNPVNGCFPSQDYICSRTNLTERAVRDQLNRLRDRGLIDWSAARENGKRGSNRYRLGFESDFQPANSAGSPDEVSTGKIEQFQPANSDTFNRQILPPNLVIEPVKEPLSAQEREREPENQVDRKKIEKDFWLLVKAWPQLEAMPKEKYRRDWYELDDASREKAIRMFPHWLEHLKKIKKDHVPVPSTYFRERLFDQVSVAAPASASLEAKPYGPVWNGTIILQLLSPAQAAPPPTSGFLRDLLNRDDDAGRAERKQRQMKFGWPQVNDWYHRAESRKGFAMLPQQAERFVGLLEAVPVVSDMLEAWRREYDQRGWPWLPDWGSQPVIFFPKGGPDGLMEFERAVRAQEVGDVGSECKAAE